MVRDASKRSLQRSALRVGPIVVIVLGAGLYLHLKERRVFGEDIRTICGAEKTAGTTILSGRVTVEDAARRNLRGEAGATLLRTLAASRPDIAASQLRNAAAGAGVTDCPAVAGYEARAEQLGLAHDVDRLCSGLSPTVLGHQKQSDRMTYLRDWAHSNVHSTKLDALLEAQTAPTNAESVARLKAAFSALGIHECGLLPGLASPLDPVKGSNVAVRGVTLPADPREEALGDALRAKVGALRECYEAALRKQADLVGDMNIKLRVAATGAIESAQVQSEASIGDEEMTKCVVSVLKSAHVPEGKSPSAGGLWVTFWVAR
jgi:hypothetical protein